MNQGKKSDIMIHIRYANKDDLPFLVSLEKQSFPTDRQFNLSAIKRSLISLHQVVFILSFNGENCGSATIFKHSKSWRLYSIAVMEQYHHQSLGRHLMLHIIDEAKFNHIEHITLEVDASEDHLVQWYRSFGFSDVGPLKDYYGPNKDGLKMILKLKEVTTARKKIKNIVVYDQPLEWLNLVKNITLIDANTFLNSPTYRNAKDMRIFNLCSSYAYQTLGYYVSLLAQARKLRAVPNVATIEDFTDETITESIGDEVQELIRKRLKKVRGNEFHLRIIFGETSQVRYLDLAKAMYRLFESPFIDLVFKKNHHWALAKVAPISPQEIHLSEELIRKRLKKVRGDEFHLRIIFGETNQIRYLDLAKAMYRLFESPFIDLVFKKNHHWALAKVAPISPQEIHLSEELVHQANIYFDHKHVPLNKFKTYKYDLAILIDPDEPAAPSGNTALVRFKKAAEKIGFYTEFITKEDYKRIPQFDALFIRATTNVNNFTYQFSRYAYSEGLVVIDDPWSIIKCANKLYFHEAMNTQGVLTPKTLMVSPTTPIEEILDAFSFPVVLKRPDSSSSLGVFKVHSLTELNEKLAQLFQVSELIIVQEYITTPFDWRIGILQNKPIFASKYFMAKGHWQIYNWGSKTQRDMVGGCETFRVEDAPKAVVDAAIKAASSMGDGFYGVDIKEVNGKVYVIEVNDNPSVDHHWEDQLLGDELYLIIMRNFMDRIEAERNIKPKIPN